MLDLTRPVQWTTDRTHVGRVEPVTQGEITEPFAFFGKVFKTESILLKWAAKMLA